MKKTILLLAILFTFTCSYSQQKYNYSYLTDSIVSILKKEQIPGVFVTVVSKDSVLYKRGIGYADIEQQIPVNTSHLFKIGSISKTFTALAIMKLVEEGKLSLDTKLAEIAPEVPFENEWETTHPVRIRHLLEHKAGFDDIHVAMFTKDRTNDMTAFDEVMEIKHSLYSRWQPGLGFAYSNTGCTILGYIIEKITNQRYQNYIKNEILVPLKMNQTDFRSAFANNLSSNEFSIGYYHKGDVIEKSRDIKIICEPAGALLSNANDMSNFLQFLLNTKTSENNNIVSSNAIETMEGLHGDLEIENNITDGYGLGIYTKTYGSKNIPFYGHNGGIHGFSSSYIYNRELNLGIALSINTMGSHKKLTKLLVDFFASQVEKVNHEENIDGSQFLDWKGEYKLVTTRSQISDLIFFPLNTVTIDISDKKISLTRFLNNKKDIYSNQNGNSFTKNKHRIPSLYFIEKDGKKYLNYKNLLFEPINSFAFLIFRIILSVSLLLGFIAILTIIVHSIISLFKKHVQFSLKQNFIITLPILLLFLPILFSFPFISSIESMEILGKINILTVFILLATTLFPVALIWALYWFFNNKTSSMFMKTYYYAIILSSLFLSVYFIYHGWFIKMMWI